MCAAGSLHRAHQRVVVGSLRQQRQVFANLNSGGPSRNRLELATNVGRRVRLHVETVELRKPTGQKDKNDRFRLGGVGQTCPSP